METKAIYLSGDRFGLKYHMGVFYHRELQRGFNERASFSGDRFELKYHMDVFYHRELRRRCNERASFSWGIGLKRDSSSCLL